MSLGPPCGYVWDLGDTQSLSLGLSCHCPRAESQPLSRLFCGPCLCALDVNNVDFTKNNTVTGSARIQCLLVESKGDPQQRSIGDNGYLKVCFCPCSGIIPSCLLIWPYSSIHPYIHTFIQLIYSHTHSLTLISLQGNESGILFWARIGVGAVPRDVVTTVGS